LTLKGDYYSFNFYKKKMRSSFDNYCLEFI